MKKIFAEKKSAIFFWDNIFYIAAVISVLMICALMSGELVAIVLIFLLVAGFPAVAIGNGWRLRVFLTVVLIRNVRQNG